MYTRLNNIYRQMKARCYNAKRKDYKRYGGRGILVCSEWLNTETVKGVKGRSSKGWLAFRDWALSHGYKDNLTLDRIDNNKGYSPYNCRWATLKMQQSNTSRNRLIEHNGKTQTLKAWCEELDLNYHTVLSRLNIMHWSIEKALPFL